jgi:ectoine hydroxylase-related dioxygenase (phytanoyl-CoA dioxygenase family)
VEAVQQVLKSTHVLLWSCDFNVKQPNTKMCFPPHQDATYAGLLPADQCVTAWVALSDPVGEEEGCLCFWEASHKKGQLSHTEQPTDVHNMLSRGQHVEDPLKEKDCVAVALRGGEATLHNFYTVHRSGPNRSTLPRVGLAIRYMAASVVQTGKVRETVTLISGSPQHDGFDLEPNLPLQNPTEVDVRIGKDAHAEAMRREAANYFDGAAISAYDESINKD